MATLVNTVRSTNFVTSIAGTPVDADTIILREGEDRYSAGLSLSTVQLTALSVFAGFNGSIEIGQTLTLDATTERVFGGGAGLVWTRAAGTSAAITTLQFSPPRGGRGVYSGFTAGIGTCFIGNGDLVFDSASDVNVVLVAGGSVLLDSGSAVTNTLRMVGGSATIKRTVTTAEIGGQARADFDHGVTGPTTLTVESGFVEYKGGDIGALNLRGGTISFARLAANITISGGEEWEGATYINPPPGITVTWSPTVYGRGARRQ